MKYRKGDQIIVTLGKDKGRKGKIEKIFPKESMVLIPGINMYKRHAKKRDERHPGGIIDVSKNMHISKIALLCPKCGQKTRIGYQVTEKDKVRICRKCEQTL